jgi:hypothetical protein
VLAAVRKPVIVISGRQDLLITPDYSKTLRTSASVARALAPFD